MLFVQIKEQDILRRSYCILEGEKYYHLIKHAEIICPLVVLC